METETLYFDFIVQEVQWFNRFFFCLYVCRFLFILKYFFFNSYQDRQKTKRTPKQTNSHTFVFGVTVSIIAIVCVTVIAFTIHIPTACELNYTIKWHNSHSSKKAKLHKFKFEENEFKWIHSFLFSIRWKNEFVCWLRVC